MGLNLSSQMPVMKKVERAPGMKVSKRGYGVSYQSYTRYGALPGKCTIVMDLLP